MTNLNYDPMTQSPCDWCNGFGKMTNQFDGKKWVGNKWRICPVCVGTKIATCSEARWEADKCNGNVQTLSGTYCNYHRMERHNRLERGRRAAAPYLSDSPPDWFDPTYAGERWDDDY